MTLSFLGRNLEALSDLDQDRLRSVLRAYPQPLSGYTPATLHAWSAVFQYQVDLSMPGTALISCLLPDSPNRHLLQPVGAFPLAEQQRLLSAAKTLPYALKLYGVTQAFLEQHPEFVAHFDVQQERGSANYIYAASDLAELPGRQYHKKRNLLSVAEREYTFQVEPLTAALIPACEEILAEMLGKDAPEPGGTLAQELTALRATLKGFAALQQDGILVRVEGRPVAFSIFEQLTPDTAVVHFEKALRQFKGLYQVVNQQAARRMAAMGYAFINREEDLGNEGLRQAKLTYFPVELRPSHVLTLRGAGT